MKEGIPDTFSDSEITDKHRSHDQCTKAFDCNCDFYNETGQANNSANVWSSNRFFHGTALHQSDFATGDHGKSNRYSNNTHSADLNQRYDYNMTKGCPVSSSVMNNQTCHAYC